MCVCLLKDDMQLLYITLKCFVVLESVHKTSAMAVLAWEGNCFNTVKAETHRMRNRNATRLFVILEANKFVPNEKFDKTTMTITVITCRF